MVQQRLNLKLRSSTLAETVTNIEELLIEILLRVPAIPLLRFKCVSKRWLSLISDLKFCHRHTLQNPHSAISAVFSHNSKNFSIIPFPHANYSSGIYHANHSHNSASWNPLDVIANQYGCIEIRDSCNGLFLCSPVRAPSSCRSPYFILNPTTSQFLTLTVPPCPAIAAGELGEAAYIIGLFLAFDPSRSPHYKVICLNTIKDVSYCNHYQLQIYSSETRSWRLLNSTFRMNIRVDYQKAVYWNGAIHWVGTFREMSYYHIDEEHVKFVRGVPHCHEMKWFQRESRYFKESTSRRHLHLIDIFGPMAGLSFTKFEVLEMRRDYSGWYVKYNVDLDPLCTSFRHIRCGMFVVLFLDRDENEEEDSSSLLLHSPGQVFSFYLKSKTFESFNLGTCQGFLVKNHNYVFKETLACV
ncbi:F-box protein At5g07610-like [Argentina anserina]|uniref:F-box protein At5g07610-like n=1 Tax=Argentina anserina TaxID=57926 RepID=UPI0021765D7E|nr:F-box protein At5g07610-like [Potentilla anserina]